MKVLRILLYIVLALVLLFLVVGFFAKKEFHLERSAVIDAPKNLVYEQVRLFANSKIWSPWTALDKNLQSQIIGEDGTVGAVYSWKGNDDVGEGNQKITSVEPTLIKHEVNFIKPFESQAASFFSVNEADGGGTKVVWGFDMKMPWPWNAFAMFTDLNKAIGKDYEKGLKSLQDRCEELAGPKKYLGLDVNVADRPTRFFAQAERQLTGGEKIPEILAASYGQLGKAFAEHKLESDGMPGGFYWPADEQNNKFDMAAVMAFKSPGKLPSFGKEIALIERTGKAISVDFYGPYEKTPEAHAALDACMADKNWELIPPAYEEYVTDPMVEKDTAKWLTRVVYYVQPKVVKEEK